jgi:redox-sensitive bicupin YhaK (pirin superfamily)
MGNGSVLRPGFVQRMSAGTGVRHSEFNHSKSELVHFLQIWIQPEKAGTRPGYEEREFKDDEKRGRLKLVASRDGRDGSVVVHQDADLYAALLAPGDQVEHALRPGRRVWIQVARGRVDVNGQALEAGDGLAAVDEASIAIRASADAEVLLFDML